MPRTLWPRRQHSFFVFGMFCVQILSGLYWLWLSLIFLSTCRQCRHSTSNEATTAYIYTHTHTHTHIYIYTGCPRRNVPDFGGVFLMLKYTDITQNIYIQSWTVTEIMAREKWDFLLFQILQPAQLIRHVTMLAALRGECSVHCAWVTLCAISHVTSPRGFLMYSACNPTDNYDMSASVLMALCHSQVSLMLSTDINITETTYSCQF